MSAGDLPKKGEIIAGKFQVEDVLGAGGMGVVVAARHLVLRQRVAVKFLLPQAARLPEARERFLREARATVNIQTEHVARVLDMGALDDGTPFMVMEFLAGTDFARLLKARGALPIADAIDYVLQAGEAIAEAHALGIIHRDLKPGNLFLTTKTGGAPLVKVLDFGLSKVIAQEDGAQEGSLTATGFVAGSPYYMSPEQIRSLKDVDWRTDIWALGAILYEMLTGRRAFEAPTLTAVCATIIADAPRSMRDIRTEIPEALEAAVLACLEKDPARRIHGVAELAQAIAPFAPQRSWGSIEQIARLSPSTATILQPESDAAATLVMPTSRSGPVLVPMPDPPRVDPLEKIAPLASPQSALQDSVETEQSDAWGQTEPVATRTPVAWIAGGAGVTIAAAAVALIWMLRTTEGAHDPSPVSKSEPTVATASARTQAQPTLASASTESTPPVPPPRVPAPAQPAAIAAPLQVEPPTPRPSKVEPSSKVQPSPTLEPSVKPSPTLEPLADPCQPNPCKGHGVCTKTTGAAACTCARGYAGSTCSMCADSHHEYPSGSGLCIDKLD
jgi:serine/threonine protein kinase